ncbi:MAG: hypothetical protein MZV64_48505 [Ignavibacteriales bacterium]|nr:hypothetical protein [Ignavibacteriales bacterium]
MDGSGLGFRLRSTPVSAFRRRPFPLSAWLPVTGLLPLPFAADFLPALRPAASGPG